MKKRLLALLLVLCMVATVVPMAAAAEVYTDIDDSAWYADAVEYVTDNGLMNGVGENKFAPGGNVSRAMMWTTLARIAGVDTTGSDPWWLVGQLWAMENGISDGTLPTDNITREQLVTMLYRYGELEGCDLGVGLNNVVVSYVDFYDISDWAYAAMRWACAAGIINGTDGYLNPQGYASRAQLAAILNRFMEEVMPSAGGAGFLLGLIHRHSYGDWTTNDNGTHSRACECGSVITKDCTYVNGVCSVCDFVESSAAKIGNTYYPSVQDAVDKAANGNTVTLLKDITSNITITQKADVKFTIDGNNKTLTGTITVDGRSQRYETAGVTIQNVNFVADKLLKDACIGLGVSDESSTRYTNNVTVKNCTFTGTGNSAVAIKSYTGGDWNLTIEGCVVDGGMHSLAQLKNVEKGLIVTDCEVNSKNGLNVNNSPSLKMSGCAFDVQGYAVRFGESGNTADENFEISGSTLKSACAETGDAVIEFRAGAVNATLTLSNTTLTGTTQFKGNTDATTIIIDGAQVVTSTNSLNDVITNAAGQEVEVTLAAGNYTLPSVSNGDVTISGTEDTVITINKPNMSGTDVAFEGVTVVGSGYATGVQHVDTVTYTDVTIKGVMCLYGNKVVFNNCTFNLTEKADYLWTYGVKEVEFNNCTFNTKGKAMLIYNEGANADTKVTVNNCTFNASASAKASAIANQNCAAIEIDSTYGDSFTLITTGTNTVSPNFSGLWRIKSCVEPVTVNGVEYTTIAIDGKTMTIDGSKNVTVNE